MRKRSTKLLTVWIAVSLVLFFVHLAFKYVSVVGHQEQHMVIFELSNRFDMNDENSVPQWFTLVSFLTITVGAWLASRLSTGSAKRQLWALISLIALLLSIDDASAIHESALGILHLTFFDDLPATFTRNAWFLILPLVLIGCIWLLATAARLLPRRTTILLVAGGSVFLVGAILFDSVANMFPARSFAGQGVVAGMEGFLQMIGLSVLVYAIADYLETHHGRLLATALKKLKV